MRRLATKLAAVHLTLAAMATIAASAGAVTQLIGDVDGFGYAPTAGLFAASGAPADTDADGIIEFGEFLPDLNGNGSVAIGSGDEFDFRSAAELAATDGAQWTDFAIIGAGAAHGATFEFLFPVPVAGDVDFGVDHFINFVFGDYDVSPATIVVDGTVVALMLQGGGQDGLVQRASAPVAWADMLDGEVLIQINAPNEPYLAFDYALLDTDQIADRDGDGIPDPLDNCPDDVNADQADADEDGAGDLCDVCPFDPDDDADGDGACGDMDNCPEVPNPDQSDLDGDGAGDLCDACTDVDGDGVCVEDDFCGGTSLTEGVPTVQLGVNRFALVDGDGVFDTVAPNGTGPQRFYTIEDTAGCSCEQIIEILDLGQGHTDFGCSISAMDDWVDLVSSGE